MLPAAKAPPGDSNSPNYDSKLAEGMKITPVGAYSASASYYGTYDQAGQLWEWTEGIYVDPTGPNRIVRGGSWGPGVTPPMKTIRRDYGPMGSAGYYRDDDTGFRLATAAGDE
jgi:formylglycine-generating enzyme required for sulfatase activity